MCRIPFFERHQRWGLLVGGEGGRQYLVYSVTADFAPSDRNPLVGMENDETKTDEADAQRHLIGARGR
jgi:hypothetical protein